MEFHERLQQLRKQKGLTQEELASVLYVSRTAISKWESGRGYPNIDSLKRIAEYFCITVDELLSSGQMLTIAEEDRKQKEQQLCHLTFALLDLSCISFLFLPLFSHTRNEEVLTGSLLSLTAIVPHLRTAYFLLILSMGLWGILCLVLQNYTGARWKHYSRGVSLLLHVCATVLFIISPQPYAAFVLFVFLLSKAALLFKYR